MLGGVVWMAISFTIILIEATGNLSYMASPSWSIVWVTISILCQGCFHSLLFQEVLVHKFPYDWFSFPISSGGGVVGVCQNVDNNFLAILSTSTTTQFYPIYNEFSQKSTITPLKSTNLQSTIASFFYNLQPKFGPNLQSTK